MKLELEEIEVRAEDFRDALKMAECAVDYRDDLVNIQYIKQAGEYYTFMLVAEKEGE